MGCYSRAFTLAILQEKPYFSRLSQYLIDQLVAFSCDELSRCVRAIDAVEGVRGTVRTKASRAFGGVLAGYGHLHYLRPDWLSTNFELSQGMLSSQGLEQALGEVAQRIVDGGGAPLDAIDGVMDKFTKRLSKATGDWVIYEERASGKFYLALNEHVRPGSPDEIVLKQLLDGIAR